MSVLLAPSLVRMGELQGQDFSYATNNGTITITGYTGPGGAVTLPSAIDNLAVTCIGSSAFRAVANFSSVIIPDSITNIGDYAFFQCPTVSGVWIGNGVIVRKRRYE